jgi:hypothetical protein
MCTNFPITVGGNMEMQNGNGKYTMKSVQQLRAKCQHQGMSLINMNQIYCKA